MLTWLQFWGGFEASNQVPEGVNDLPVCVPIASQCQYGMGIAWGCKLRGEGRVCATFCGDGGTSEGDFHEALNFAGVYNLPLVMVIQNNQLGDFGSAEPPDRGPARWRRRRSRTASTASRWTGTTCSPMIAATREAVEKARTGGGPTLIEAVTYRLSMHTTADDPKKYRKDEEVKEWEPRDPLLRFATYLRKKQLLDPRSRQVIDEEIAARDGRGDPDL